MKLKIKKTALIKALLITILAAANLHSAFVYAANNENQTQQRKQIYIHAFPQSNGEGHELILIKKSIFPQKLNVVKTPRKTINKHNIFILKITSIHSLAQLNKLNITSNIKLVLTPIKQEFIPNIVKKAGGNKLFELATKINDKLQLFITRFKKIFTVQNNLKKFPLPINNITNNSQCNLNS
jgi:hypothetical protein